jgi:hypothetical protein
MKTIKNMKENTNKASNLIIGAIYINANTGQPARLVNIVSCQGVWLEAYDGQGYGDLVQFNDCHYASQDEVQDYLDDLRVYTASQKAPPHKVMTPFGIMENHAVPQAAPEETRVKDYDKYWGVTGYYEDSYGNDIRCRD